jgi:hypothetical protein
MASGNDPTPTLPASAKILLCLLILALTATAEATNGFTGKAHPGLPGAGAADGLRLG